MVIYTFLMHIDFCLLASDLNDNYYGLYPYVKKAWKKIGIETKLILISDYIPDNLKQYECDITLFKPIENIHTAFQAQTIRLLYPCLFDNKNIIISDMDIIPLSKLYFTEKIKNYSNDRFIVYRDAYIQNNMYAACYNLANSTIWKRIFSVNNENDVIQQIKSWYDPVYDGKKNCQGWFTDQKMLFKYLNTKGKAFLTILKDKELNFSRLDKRNRKYIVENLSLVYNDIKNKCYTDFPYHKYIDIINSVIDLIDI